MSNRDVNARTKGAPAFWGPLSLALPFCAAAFSALFLGDRNMAHLIYFLSSLAGVGVAGVLEMAAAVRAEIRAEEKPAYRAVGFLVNGLVIIVGLWVVLRLTLR